jgi:hypothetical protein
MRRHQPPASQRQPEQIDPERQEGAILAERPNRMWGIDATAGLAPRHGQVPVFAMIDYHSAYCLGIHLVGRGTRFDVREPVRQEVLEQFGGISESIAQGVKLR